MQLLKGDGQTSKPKGALKLVQSLKKGDLRLIGMKYENTRTLISKIDSIHRQLNKGE